MKNKTTKNLVIGGGAIIILAGLGALFVFGKSQNLTGTKVDTSDVPVFTAQAVNGKTFEYKSVKGKRPVIVTSMATWCSSCIQNTLNLNTALTQLGREDISIVSISVDPNDNEEKLKNFQEKYVDDSWYVLKSDAGNPKVLSIFGIQTIDQTFLITKNGSMIDTFSQIKTVDQWKEAISKI